MKRTFLRYVLGCGLAISASPALAAECLVTVATGTGAGSLPARVADATCTTIKFDTAAMQTSTVTLSGTLDLASGVILDGQFGADGSGKVVITGNLGANIPLFKLTKSGTTLRRVQLTHPNSTVLQIAGISNTTVQNAQLSNSKVGILVITGTGNWIDATTFTGISQTAISLVNLGNKNLAAPTLASAKLGANQTWELSGTADAAVTKVALFRADAAFPTIPQGTALVGTATATGGVFTLSGISVDNFHPGHSYTALAYDANKNTSKFAANFKPTSDPNFYAAVPACATAAWWTDLTAGGWAKDFDTGGKTNGAEDANHNCVKDAGETDPANLADDALPADTDQDGIADSSDNCPSIPNVKQTDTDSDTSGDACDTDDDNDSILDTNDNCPLIPNKQVDTDGDKVGDACDTDDDGDGVDDTSDNCPSVSNPDQFDTDADGPGDACDATDDSDTDADGILDTADNCPSAANPDQFDTDGDGIGDACDADDVLPDDPEDNPDDDLPLPDTDADNDGVDDDHDNCPTVFNINQADIDLDGSGDACDAVSDNDADSVPNGVDNCATTPNLEQLNTDGDIFGDACDADDDNDGRADALDNCPWDQNADQLDSDGDKIGDACATGVGQADDIDADGVGNGADNCPFVGNTAQEDADHDGSGDGCDPDRDADARANEEDNCPLTPNPEQTDTDQDSFGDACDPSNDQPSTATSATGDAADAPAPTTTESPAAPTEGGCSLIVP